MNYKRRFNFAQQFMQPDPNQHPRFRWKPEDDSLSSASLPARENQPGGRRPADESKITSLRVKKKDFDVIEIRCDKLALSDIAEVLGALRMPIAPELLEHLAAAVDRGGPLDPQLPASFSDVLDEISLKHLKDYLIEGANVTTQWVYLLKKQPPDEEEEFGVLQPHPDKDMLVRLYKGAEKGKPQLVIDWNGVVYDADNPLAKRWETVEQVLEAVNPALEIQRMPNLTEFVDEEATKREMGLVLRFKTTDVVVTEADPPEHEERLKSDEDDLAVDGPAGEGPDLNERLTEDWSSDKEEQDEARVLLERPARGDAVIVQHLTPKKLEVLSRLAGFPLRKEFFERLMEIMESGHEPHEGLLRLLKEIGREISFSKETLYVNEDGCVSKWSDVLVGDEAGPFGRFIINVSHVCASNSDRRVLAAKLKFHGSSDEIKKLPWEKILKAAGY